MLTKPHHFILAAVATADLQSSLAQFVTFARSLKAQLFLDKFFRALGHGGVQQAGTTLEFRIAKKPGSAQLELIKGDDVVRAKGGKKFTDLLWLERVFIEMKSRDANLEKPYDQTFEYWTHIVPRRPPFVILCNFDEFWIYDFNTQFFDPVERLHRRDLPQNGAAPNFLFPTPPKPIFGNNRVDVTRKAANIFARVFHQITTRGQDRARARRFIVQLLVSVVEARLRYSAAFGFDIFPWPQMPTKGRIAEVTAAVPPRAVPREVMGKLGYALPTLYHTLKKPGDPSPRPASRFSKHGVVSFMTDDCVRVVEPA